MTDRLTITFKDSLRIFPVSLNELCKIYNVEGKLTEYRQEFNHISILDEDKTNLLEELRKYNRQDSNSLFTALDRAQHTFYCLHRIDIVDIVSTSSLALKIFRSKYLEVNIPVLNNVDDTYIRKAYFGGATDIYLPTLKKAKYYDVNSLYPFAMLKPMPLKILRKVSDGSSIDLNNFFGQLRRLE